MSVFKKKYQIENDIYIFDTSDTVLKKVEKFYDRAPFPHYETNETKFDILKKGNSNILANQFKKFCGFNKLILEAGSGTCQLSNYLSLGTNNKIYALDATKSSLEEGLKFKKKNKINNLYLVKGDILEKNFEKNTFDLIWCSGVLHHTKDPYLGFVNLCNYLKDGGYILIGLYNKYGRLRTLIRKYLSYFIMSKFLKKKFLNFVDPVLRSLNKNRVKNIEKIDAWMQDQYLHPVESLHTLDEVLNWFTMNNIEYISSIPSCDPSISINKKKIFVKEEKGNFITRILVQLGMLFDKMGSEGGLFIVIGKKMTIINNKLDFILIKFPIIFPILYALFLFNSPHLENIIIITAIFLLAEPHFGATWPFFINKRNKNYIEENKIQLVIFPILIIIFCLVGFFLFRPTFLLIFFAANIYHVTRQSYGILKLYTIEQKNILYYSYILYFFNILFFIVGLIRFYSPIVKDSNLIYLNLIIPFIFLIIIILFISQNEKI